MFDGLGPYSIEEIQTLADELVPGCMVGDPSKEIFENSLTRPSIILWRSSPRFGHFICLHPREGGVEVFDPMGTGTQDDMWRSYMTGGEFNSPGLRGFLQQLMDAGVKVSYNNKGPQAPETNSCGLYCLLRAMAPELPPSKFKEAAG